GHTGSPAAAAAAAADADALAPGTVVGRYHIVRYIGAGGMGVVYEAHDRALDRAIALKLVRPDAVNRDGKIAARLVREARVAAGLSHPNIVAVHEVGVHDGRPFIAMELVAGVSVRQWLAEGPRTSREIVDVFVQAGRGIAAAHAAGFVHRDV